MEEKEYDIDVVADKGIFLQKRDCLDNGSGMVMEIVKRGKWEHNENDTIRYVGWKAILRKTDEMFPYSHRRVSEAKVVRVDGGEDQFTITIKRLNGYNRRSNRTI
jgi:hypothetical protein